jgi:hypothetical protein
MLMRNRQNIVSLICLDSLQQLALGVLEVNRNPAGWTR